MASETATKVLAHLKRIRSSSNHAALMDLALRSSEPEVSFEAAAQLIKLRYYEGNEPKAMELSDVVVALTSATPEELRSLLALGRDIKELERGLKALLRKPEFVAEPAALAEMKRIKARWTGGKIYYVKGDPSDT